MVGWRRFVSLVLLAEGLPTPLAGTVSTIMGDDFKLEFSLDPKNQLRQIRYSLVFYLGAVGGLIYFLVMHEVVGLYIAVGFFILIIPQVLIHLQYFLNDRKLQITVNHSAKQLIIYDRTNEVLRYDDIERIF
ncbi:MAG: hypothetical protein DHS20C17_13970 [Cyclobacteriaceae bacterium]|nr:MAG: hypothetical protein DHS20C17_13970 [Cyclobacteriaceae bacterium]